MIEANVLLNVDTLGLPDRSKIRRQVRATTKQDVREHVKHYIRMAYGSALALVHSTSDGSATGAVLDMMQSTLHTAHIEWNDDTSEALVVELDLPSIARSSCVHMVHKMFNEGM